MYETPIYANPKNHRAIQFSSFSLHFREDRDSEIARTEERLEHQVRTTGQLNGSGVTDRCLAKR